MKSSSSFTLFSIVFLPSTLAIALPTTPIPSTLVITTPASTGTAAATSSPNPDFTSIIIADPRTAGANVTFTVPVYGDPTDLPIKNGTAIVYAPAKTAAATCYTAVREYEDGEGSLASASTVTFCETATPPPVAVQEVEIEGHLNKAGNEVVEIDVLPIRPTPSYSTGPISVMGGEATVSTEAPASTGSMTV